MTLRFHDDGTFRVLQMADIQDGPEVNRDTIRMIEAAINEAKPDLVVIKSAGTIPRTSTRSCAGAARTPAHAYVSSPKSRRSYTASTGASRRGAIRTCHRRTMWSRWTT